MRAGGAGRALVAVAVAVPLFLATPAGAEDGKPRVVVLADGAGAERLRADAERALGDTVTQGDAGDLERAWTARGFAGRPGLGPGGRVRRAEAVHHLRDAARDAGFDAVVVASAGPRSSRVMVVSPSKGTPLLDSQVSRAPRGRSELRRFLSETVELVAELAPHETPTPSKEPTEGVESQGAPPGAPSPPPTPALLGTEPLEGPEPSRPSADSVASRHPLPAGPAVDVSVGFELGLRDFRYNDRLTTNLRSYSVAGAPLIAGAVDVSPFAAKNDPVLSRLGLVAGYGASAGMSSSVEGTSVATSWSHFFVGPLFRVRFEGRPAVIVDASVAYAGESMSFSGVGTSLAAQLPSVAYRDVRPALGARIEAGPFAGRVEVGYSYVLSAGDVAERFGGASVAGLDGLVGGSVAVGLGFEARLFASYRRFFYAFHPEPGDAYVAGGAVDQLASLHAAIAWTH